MAVVVEEVGCGGEAEWVFGVVCEVGAVGGVGVDVGDAGVGAWVGCDRPPGFGPFLLRVLVGPRPVSVVDGVDTRAGSTGPGRVWGVALT